MYFIVLFLLKVVTSICSFTPKSSCLSGQKVILYSRNKKKKEKEKKHNSHQSLLENDILEVRAGKELAAILIWNATEYFLKAGSHYFYGPVMSYVHKHKLTLLALAACSPAVVQVFQTLAAQACFCLVSHTADSQICDRSLIYWCIAQICGRDGGALLLFGKCVKRNRLSVPAS